MKDKIESKRPKNLITNATRKLVAVLEGEKKDIWLLYIYAVLSGIISLTLPLGVQAIITYLMGAYMSTSLVLLIALVISGTFFIGVLQLFQLSIVEVLQQRLFMRSSLEYAFRVPLLRLHTTGKFLFHELANRFFDTLTLQKQVPKLLMDLSAALLQMLFGLILISFYHPFFAFFSLLVFLLLFLFFRISGPRGLASSLEESEEKYRIAFFLQKLGFESTWFKASNPFKSGLKKVDAMLSNYLDARKKHFRVLRSQYQVLILFKTLIISILLIIGGNLVLEGQINLGQFIAAEIVIILIMASVEKLLLSMEGIYDVLTAVEKVAKIPKLEIDQPEGYASVDMPSKIELHGVEIELAKRFSLPDMEISLEESIAWEGGSDLQKGAFIASILGHIPLNQGNIRIDGLVLAELNLMVWRQRINQVSAAGMIENVSLAEYLEIETDSEKMMLAQRYCDLLGISKRLDSFGLTLRDPLNPTWYFNKVLFLWQVGILRSLINGPKILIIDLDSLPQTILKEVDFESLIAENTHHWWVFGCKAEQETSLKRYVLEAIMLEKGEGHA